MKKILIAGALLSAISTSALAEVGMVYFRVDAGATMVNNLNSDGNYFAQKFDARNTPFINLGLGWNVMDNVRTDVNFSYQFNNKFTANALTATQYGAAPASMILADTGNYSQLTGLSATVMAATEVPGEAQGDPSTYIMPTAANGVGFLGTAAHATALLALGSKVNLASVSGVSVQDTLKTWSVMPRVYFDLFDYGGGKFFVGAALGYANVEYQSDLTVSYKANTKAEMEIQVSHHNYVNANALAAKPADQTVSLKSPTVGNFAFGLHAGMDYKIPSWEGVKLNLEYSYTNYGQIKKLTVSAADVVLANPLTISMNNLSLGLRIEM